MCLHTYTLGLSASSTMNNCVGFLNEAINKFRFFYNTKLNIIFLIPLTCKLMSPCITDLSGNNSFGFTTNLGTEKCNFVTLSGGSGCNI